MTKPKKISQQRIAKALGVSQALVSLALNGHKDGIKAETYQRIWDYAISKGYRPKGMHFDSMPQESQTRQIGVILRSGASIHNQGSYFNRALHGLHMRLAQEDCATVFLGSEDTLNQRKLERFFRSGNSLRGAILLGEVSASFLNLLRTFERRIVAVSARHPGLCHSVVGNETAALDAVVGHLHELGHRKIGWIGGNVGLGRHEVRYKAFISAMEQRGLALNKRYHAMVKQADRSEGIEALFPLLPHARSSDFPTAFVTYNTLMAAGALKLLQREGVSVPGDISIAGADNSQIALLESPTLTMAGTDSEALGSAAGDLVLQSTGKVDEIFHELILPSQLVIGQSTGPARVKKSELAV